MPTRSKIPKSTRIVFKSPVQSSLLIPSSVATVRFHPVQRAVFVNAELDHGFGSAKSLNAELNAVERVQNVQFRFIGSLNQN